MERITSQLPDLPARYDLEAKVLEIPVIPAEDWTNGIDLDALVVIDLTAALAVANIDVLVPKERWKLGLPIQVTEGRISPARLYMTAAAAATRQTVWAPFTCQEREGLGRQMQAAMDRYLAGWRSWFDRPA